MAGGDGMNLYLISQSVNDNYDTFDSAVVAAETEEKARLTHPSIYIREWNGIDNDVWANSDKIIVKLLGTAADGTPVGVICASFNAG